MTTHDQSRPAGKGSTADSPRGGHLASTWWRLVALSVFVSILCLSGYWLGGNTNAANAATTYSGVTFWTEITGSDKDGFDVLASYPGPDEKKCKVTVTVTLSDGSKKTYDYSGTVRKTDRVWFGGEAGLKPAPISEVTITSGSCE